MAGWLWRTFRPVALALHDSGWYLARVSSARLRKHWPRYQAAERQRDTVVHVTNSFDVGGTQTQIQRLCEAQGTRYRHSATEFFPELNFLFRRGVTIEPERYGGASLGRIVANRDWRGFQLVQVYKLVREFRAERPAVVAAWGHETCVTTFVAAALAGVPHIVFCIRTFNPESGWADAALAAQLRRAHRAMSPMVSRVIANSTAVRDEHARWAGIDPGSIAVCNNGVDVAVPPDEARRQLRRAVRATLGIPEDAVVIVNVGRFSREKGQSTLVEAARAVGDASHPVVWLMVGDGPTLDAVRESAGAAGLSNVIFTGRTGRVQDMLAAADIFVMPSDFEGQPNAMMEAMAMGLPSVSTNRSGATDIARDGAEALYYEPRNISQLIKHLQFLLIDPDRARAIGAAARERVGEFDVARMVRCFEDTLDGVATARH